MPAAHLTALSAEPAPGSAASSDLGTFTELLVRVRKEVDQRLAGLFERKLDDTRPRGPDVAAMIGALGQLTLRGGKRFRPALAVAAFESVGGEANDESVLELGVALELLQAYFLVHDDWMDRDDVRRGGPAVHVLLAQHFQQKDRGDAAAILAGDFAAALSLESLTQALVCHRAQPDTWRDCLQVFAEAQQDAVCGQQIDLASGAENVELMHELKTGSYTVRGPLLLGGLLGGGSTQALASLRAYARPLGVAFQLRDDLLGTFGRANETGKRLGGDLREGKHTALVCELRRRATFSELAQLEGVLGNPTASNEQVESVMLLMEERGVRTHVERMLDRLVTEATDALEGAKLTSRGLPLLRGAALALTLRNH